MGGAEAGICIEPENEAELLEAVTKLAQDPALARRLGASGLERIAKKYDYDALAPAYLAALERLLAGGKLH